MSEKREIVEKFICLRYYLRYKSRFFNKGNADRERKGLILWLWY